jgi:hypothetical protein
LHGDEKVCVTKRSSIPNARSAARRRRGVAVEGENHLAPG